MTGTGILSGLLKRYHTFYGHFPGRLPVPKVKRELRVLALPPNEVLSQLQFCRAYLGLSPGLAETWWKALCRSKWSRPTALRQATLLFEVTPRAVPGFLHNTCAPAELVAALEDLASNAYHA